MAGRKDAGEAASAPGEEISFEAALERLETIVEELEGGALTLEESIARYEEGVKLSRRLTQTLDQAEQRIERLVQHELAGAPTTTPIDLEENNGGSEPDSRDRSGPEALGGEPGPGVRRAPRVSSGPSAQGPPVPRPERTVERGLPPDELPF